MEELDQIQELTTSASSGGYETMFGMPACFNNKNLKDEDKEAEPNIIKRMFKEENIAKITKRVLIESFVIPSTSNMFGKGRENVDGKNPYKGINVKQTEDIRIEAGQNGLLDINYSYLPKKAAEQMKAALKKGDDAGGSGVPSKLAQQMLDDAKKRYENDPNLSIKYKGLMGDVEIDPNETSDNPLKTIVETKTMKKLVNKRVGFKNSGQLESLLETTLPETYKVDGQEFFVEDANSTLFKVKWDGSKTNGVPIVLEQKNPLNEEKKRNTINRLMHYDPMDSNSVSSKLNENTEFNKNFRNAKNAKIV
jgi:hypothetical protein